METIGIMFDLLFLFLAGAISFILYPMWINFVYKFQMGESIRSDGPQTHVQKVGTPTMGGLIFVVTVALITFIFNRSRTQTLLPVLVASSAGLLGLLEDFTKVYRKSGLPGFFEYYCGLLRKNPILGNFFNHSSTTDKKWFLLKPWYLFKDMWRVVGSADASGIQTHQKFLFQALMGGFVAYWTYFKLGWDFIWFPLMGNVHIGFLYPIVVFLLFIVILNAVAFTDGLDGLAGGLAFISFVSFWLLSRLLDYNSLAVFCATFVGALIPFLYFNFYPARIFMGNVGSHVLGATLAVLAVVLHREIPFLVMGLVFLVDGISSPLQQLSVKFTGKRLFRMAPIHHHFELLGWPEVKVTLRFLLCGIFVAFAGIFLALL